MARIAPRPFAVRPELTHLEERTQPGSLLVGGVDLSPFEDWLPRPESSEIELVAPKKSNPLDDEVEKPVATAAATEPEVRLAAPRSQAIKVEARRDSSINPLANLPITPPARPSSTTQVASTSSTPTAAKTNNTVTNQSTQARQTPTVDLSMAIRSPVVDTPTQGVVYQSTTTKMAPANLRFERHDCEETGTNGPEGAVWNNYFGTPGEDENFAVASGKGALIGDSYAVGHTGPIGTIVQYGPAGGCKAAFAISSPTGAPVEVRDVATNITGVYVVGTILPDAEAFVLHLSPALVPLMSISVPAPAGGTVSLNGVGISPSGTMPNVYVTGHVFDPLLAPVEMTRVISYSTGLGALLYDSMISFGSDSRGRSIDADRPQNAYIAGIIDVLGVTNHPHQFRLSAGGAIIPWAFTSSAGAPVINLDNGMNGVRFIGGTTGALGVYLTGTVEDAFLNPGFDNQIVLKRVPATGAIVYASIVSFFGTDLGGQANAVDRAGDQFTAGFIGVPAPRDAFFAHYGPMGMGPLDAIPLGTAAGFADQGNGIDLRTTAPGDDVFGAGWTDTPTALMFPPPGPCDPTANGMTDGFNARFFQPL
jgi:hypothetical protein